MTETISDKGTMYKMLSDGIFGNTINQYFSADEWEQSSEAKRVPQWGVRTLVPGGPCRLFCPREEVRQTAELPEYQKAGVNISMMIDLATNVTLWGEVYDSPVGLLLYGIEYPARGSSWRKEMPYNGRHWEGTACRLMLAKHLNANSRADLDILIGKYPGHVYEFSACEDELGAIPGRNAVFWEVRAY